MLADQKVIQKIIDVLSADSVVKSYCRGRIYASHISSVERPVYPAISLHLISRNSLFSVGNMVEVNIQIDAWLSSRVHSAEDVFAIQERFTALLQRANLSDLSLSLIVGQVFEVSSGPYLFEADTELLHLPARYQVVAS